MIVDELSCPYCPAARFPNRTRLNEHAEECRLAMIATIPCDPLAVLREALVWAEDEDRLRLIPAELRPLFEPRRLQAVKSPPGFVASMVGNAGVIEVRARLKTGGLELHLQVDVPPLMSQRTRVHLPPQFAVRPINSLQKEAA